MGWLSDDPGHEGWTAYVLADGRVGIGSCGAGVLLPRRDDEGIRQARAEGRMPPTEELHEVAGWEQVAGWVVGCECGWRGPRWDRAVTAPTNRAGEPWDGADADSATLPDGTTVDDAAYTVWLAHVAPFEVTLDVKAAADVLAKARRMLDDAVAEARSQGATWEQIGQAAGVTRQTAHERWATR